jgi:hypothetical protein
MKPSIGHIILLLGALAFLGVSFMPWYEQSGGRTENGWDGEYSLAASAGAAAALLFGLLAVVKGSAVWRFLALLGAAGALGFTYMYFDYNGRDIIVYDRIIPSGMQKDTVQIALIAAGVMALGGLLGLRGRK